MEPKDLKNSEELRSPDNEDLKTNEQNVASDEEQKVEDVTPVAAEEKVTAEAEVTNETEPSEETENVASDEEQKVEDVTPVAAEETLPAEAEVISETESSEETENVTSDEEQKVEDVTPVAAEEKVTAEAVEEEKTEPLKEESTDAPAEEKKEAKVEAPVEVVEEREQVDYTDFSQVELINALRDLLDNHAEENLRNEIEAIKAVFYKNLNEKSEEAKQKFIEEGGIEEEYKVEEDPYENDIKNLLKRYRQIRADQNKKLEFEKEDNLKRKYEVIEKIKGLINNEESINKTFNEFRELQKEWREIGLVPQAKMKNLWDTYHFHVENFYDYIKINRELRDLDLKKNLETKIKLCERAEELLVEPSTIKAFNTLQKFHEQWREVGPVPREQKDEIWDRFKAATDKINKKHQQFFENRKTEQKKNLEAKTALCEKVEEIAKIEISSHRDWDEKSKELIELQKVWRTIGFAPRKDNNKIYERFRTACDSFFDAKREFYAKNKAAQQNNLQLKIDLCVQAEALKDSTDWKKTTQDYINIQKKWKEIGAVPRKHSDSIWKRFRTACDYFFDKKSEHFSGQDSEQVENLKLKEQLIEEIIQYKASDDVDENLQKLKEFQRRWTEIGHVPFKKKNEMQIRFREAINKLYDELNIDDERRNMLKFKTKMSSFSESSKGQNKMRLERDKYMNKMKQLENDLVLLDNNIGFFAKSKNAESLIEDVKKKIEVTKQKIEFLKDKIRVIDEMDKDEY